MRTRQPRVPERVPQDAAGSVGVPREDRIVVGVPQLRVDIHHKDQEDTAVAGKHRRVPLDSREGQCDRVLVQVEQQGTCPRVPAWVPQAQLLLQLPPPHV